MGSKKKYVITKKKSKTQKSNEKSKSKSHISKDVFHKYTKYYPSILDPDFSKKIAGHTLFKKYKSEINQERLENLYKAYDTNEKPHEDTNKQNINIFILKTITKMLRNFMSPYSPYRSLLIYHEMGVGKTCTAITIAESLKHIVKNSNTKIYVIRPDEFARQIFRKEAIYDGKPLNQCTGDTYIQNPKLKELVDNCTNKNNDACESLKLRVDKDIRSYYKFGGYKMWAREVLKEIESKTKNLETESEKHNKLIEVIQKLFNNSVIIIDEAHELRDSNEKEAKVITPVLNNVLEYASNVRLIFLTATPIYDKPQDIISLINYFLLNDNRKVIKENNIFDKEGNLKPDGYNVLLEKTRGYISFLRGSNPYEFPIRLSASNNITNDILNLKDYPRKNYKGNKLDRNDQIKYLELVDCKITGIQRELFNYHIKNDELIDIDEDTLDLISISDLSNEYNSKSQSNEKSKKSQSQLFKINMSEDPDVVEMDDFNEDYTENYNKEDNISIDELINLEERVLDLHSNNHKKMDNKQLKRQSNIPLKISTVAYQFESQMSNIVYQTLEECNGNLKLAVGELGLAQIVRKNPSKWTYEFNDPKYAKRFKLPELYNWGAKIAKVVDLAIKSSENDKGPIFIYTNFVNAGAKPIAIALEMNGFRRYKMYDSPLIESSEKVGKYRGDYILYTGDASLSSYVKEYLNKREKMIYEKTVKIFIGTSVASEGLNLFGYREVHIIDPWHNINLTEQSIGRVIRTGSHLHLPPQERNVTVYQYASTIGDRESYDLKIYKISEKKAIKSGIVEKIMRENALDCELNKEVNIYDSTRYNKQIPQITSHGKKIMVSLADTPFSRNCFYLKECGYNCKSLNKSVANLNIAGKSIGKENKYDNYPIMPFNYDKELEEYKNLIINLVKTSFNVNINYLREYLKKIVYGYSSNSKNKVKIFPITKKSTGKLIAKITKKQNVIPNSNTQIGNSEDWNDEDSFQGAIQEIINTDITTKDKFGREGKIILSGDTLRFVPNEQSMPNISINKQYLPPAMNPPSKTQIDLKGFITKLGDEQKRVVEEEEINYEESVNKTIEKAEQIYYGVYQKEYKFNIKVKQEEIVDLVYNKLNYSLKVTILKYLLEKIVRGIKLNDNERKIEPAIHNNIVYLNEVFHNIKQDKDAKKSIYGFIIQNITHLELFILNDNKKFEKNQGNLKKIIEYRKNIMKTTPNNKLYGFLKYEKGSDTPFFKITDIVTKGEKKSVRGITCITDATTDIKKNLNKLDDKILKNKFASTNKNALCNDIELLMKRHDNDKLDGKKWYYTPEEQEIFFGDQ
jgi:hypothetical protein